MIRINNDIREQKYEAAATQIDAMIADTTINQQELIGRLKFIARLGYKAEELPEFWFNKCVGYLQYIAYNQTDRDDAFIHQEYAAALEMVLRKLNGKAPIPASLSTEPAYGKKVYNMRPDALKMKPKRKNKMRTLKSILVLGLALSTFTAAEAAKLTFKVTNPNEKVKVILTFSQSGEQKEVAIDAAGNGNIEITGFTPQYVTMQYTCGRRTLYLDPNQDLTCHSTVITCGETQPLKEQAPLSTPILGSKELRSLGMPDMKMQEAPLYTKETACMQSIAKYWKPQNFQPISLHRKKYVCNSIRIIISPNTLCIILILERMTTIFLPKHIMRNWKLLLRSMPVYSAERI